MVYRWCYDHFGWFGLPGASLLFGFAFWAIFVHLSYYYYFVRHRDRYVPDYRASVDQLREAARWSILNIVGNAALLLPIQLFIVFDWSRLYLNLGDYGWPYLVASSLGAVAFAETGIYWAHRLLHAPPFYHWLHAVHHRFREPNPTAAYAFNPADSFFQSLPYHVYVFIVPTNFWIYFSLYIFSSFWAVMIHDRVRWIPAWLGPIVNHTGCHTIHHQCYAYNYGNYFTFWDKLCGTYCDPARLPAKFLAAKGPAGMEMVKTLPDAG
jgi:Delta7-sterol 5-desaturase